jgi:hypothetical protein
MDTTMITQQLKLYALLLMFLATTGCPLPPSIPPPPIIPMTTEDQPISGSIVMWVSADQDTYISCGRTSACEEGNLNFGRHSPLAVAGWDLARKMPFIHFRLPELPTGTKILETYIELYHNGRNEDGRTDDLKIPVARPAPWDAMILTWNNSANTSSTAGAYNICLRSLAWSGSPNIAGDIQGKQEYDVFLSWAYPGSTPPIEKGFASDNDFSRTQNNLGLAPRLLVKAQLPPGTTISSRAVRTFQPSEDLGRLTQPVLMMIAEQTAVWPPAWQVATTSGDCV